MGELFRCQQLRLQQGSRTLVNKLDLTIQPNQCWVVLGPNGVGKSTLLHAMGGLLSKYATAIQLQQQPLSAYTAKARAAHIGLLLQQGEPGFKQNVFDMVAGGLYRYQSSWQWNSLDDEQRVLGALQRVGLTDKANQSTHQLSGGERRRAEIARLLLQNPGLALLDEPLNHLDIGQQIGILQILRQQFQTSQQALVLVLHDINLACHVASHLLLLFEDGAWMAGESKKIATQSNLSRLFQYPLKEVNTEQGKLFSVNYALL